MNLFIVLVSRWFQAGIMKDYPHQKIYAVDTTLDFCKKLIFISSFLWHGRKLRFPLDNISDVAEIFKTFMKIS